MLTLVIFSGIIIFPVDDLNILFVICSIVVKGDSYVTECFEYYTPGTIPGIFIIISSLQLTVFH